MTYVVSNNNYTYYNIILIYNKINSYTFIIFNTYISLYSLYVMESKI